MQLRMYKDLSIYRLQGFFTDLSERKAFILSFLLGFAIRSIPEVLSYPNPIGFDTIQYAVRIKTGVVWQYWESAFSTWLLYAISAPLQSMLQGDPFLLLKLLAPALYALNVGGVYYFARNALKWETKGSLIAALIFSFQLSSLRISWDLYRNMLGLAILLFLLPWTEKVETKKGLVLFVLLSMLIVFAHEYVAVIMFAVAFTVVIADVHMRRMRRAGKLLMAALPALATVIIGIYLNMYPAPTFMTANVVEVNDAAVPRPFGLFFLVNYLGVESYYRYPSYLDLLSNVFFLFFILYLLLLPLVLVGFFRNRLLDGWTLLLLLGTFDAILTPFFALDLWYKAIFLMVYPFTFYAANGFRRIQKAQGASIEANHFRWLGWMKTKKITYGIMLVTLTVALVFMTSPLFEGFRGFSNPTTSVYPPSSMLTNTVPLGDTIDTVKVMKWLNGYMEKDGVVLIHHVFLSWAELYLRNEHKIFYFEVDINKALNMALERGFTIVYFVWWNENIDWYDLSVPRNFAEYFSSGRISVFKRS